MAEETGTTRPLHERRTSAREVGGGEYEARREDILAGAASAFREKGFHGATLNDIALKSGCDRATVYYYFSSKLEIFREMVLDHIVENISHAEALVKRSDLSPGEKLREAIIQLMTSYEAHYPDLFIYIQQDMSQVDTEESEWSEAIKDLSRRYDRAITKVIQDGIDAGEFSTSLSARTVAYAVIGMLNWAHRWYRPDVGPSRPIGVGFADLVLRGLRSR